MQTAGIGGPHATPKGLRHGFGVRGHDRRAAVFASAVMGHAQLTTTAIYAQAVGEEERQLAARMWWCSPRLR
jgi:integrase